jgi:hypothetical protein
LVDLNALDISEEDDEDDEEIIGFYESEPGLIESDADSPDVTTVVFGLGPKKEEEPHLDSDTPTS